MNSLSSLSRGPVRRGAVLRRGVVGVALLIAAAGPVTAASPLGAAMDLRPEDLVEGPIVVTLKDPDVPIVPGSFHSVLFWVENPAWEARVVRLRVEPPPGWQVVTAEREVRVERVSRMRVPFTLVVPADAVADATHPLGLLITSSADPASPAQTSLDLLVAPQPRCRAVVTSPPFESRPGERVSHVVRLTNTGNVNDIFTVDVDGTPAWPQRVEPGFLELAPGESGEIRLEVRIPRDVRERTLHVLRLTIRSDRNGHDVVATASASIQVEGELHEPGTFRWLPVEVGTAVLSDADTGTDYTLNLRTRGPLSEDVRFAMDGQLLTERLPDGSARFRARRVRADVVGSEWHVLAGHIPAGLPDLLVSQAGRRGFQAQWAGEAGRFVAMAGQERESDRMGFGFLAERQLSRSVHSGLSYLEREADPGQDPRDERLALMNSRIRAGRHTEVTADAAWSHRTGEASGAGGAGQLRVDYRGSRTVAKVRVYGGTPRFVGRYEALRSLNAHTSFRPGPGSRYWTNLDATQRPESEQFRDHFSGLWTNGVRLEEPALEFEVRNVLTRSGPLGEDLEQRTHQLRLGTWRESGDWIMGFTGRTGRSHSQEGANPWTRAEEVGWEFRATGPFHGIRMSTSLARIWERPGSEYRYQRSTRWVSSLDWMSPTASRASTWSLGATFTGSEAGAFGGGELWRSLEVRPRIEWRPRGTLRVRAEATAEWSTAGFRAERLEFRMSWSGEDVVPVPWFDGGDAITARVFLDRNLDGRRNAGEPTLEGVAFRIDGTRRTSDRDGRVRFPEAIGMGYRVLLESGSVAADLVSARPFPREIRVPSDRGREIELPFVLAGSVTVRVFQDEDRDGHLDPGEPGLEMLRVELTRGGERVVSGVTDDRGVLRFPRVPPGEYVLRIAPGWSPPGWEDTGAAETNVRVEPGEETLATPIGLARVQKPIRRTFQGGRSQNSPRSPK